MSSKKGRLIVVSGPSGVGKSTLIVKLLGELTQLHFSVSYTTRQKRRHEVEGRDYHFTDPATFERMITEGGFLEWEKVHGYYYGTPVTEVLAPLSAGIDVILDIDVKGALKVRQKCECAALIFIEPPSVPELMKRLSSRGETEIAKRLARVEEEMSQRPSFTYLIRNDNLNSAYERFRETIAAIRRSPNGEDHC